MRRRRRRGINNERPPHAEKQKNQQKRQTKETPSPEERGSEERRRGEGRGTDREGWRWWQGQQGARGTRGRRAQPVDIDRSQSIQGARSVRGLIAPGKSPPRRRHAPKSVNTRRGFPTPPTHTHTHQPPPLVRRDPHAPPNSRPPQFSPKERAETSQSMPIDCNVSSSSSGLIACPAAFCPSRTSWSA